MGSIITTIMVAQKTKWDDNGDNTIYAYDGVGHKSLMLQAVRSVMNHVTKTLSRLSGFSLRELRTLLALSGVKHSFDSSLFVSPSAFAVCTCMYR